MTEPFDSTTVAAAQTSDAAVGHPVRADAPLRSAAAYAVAAAVPRGIGFLLLPVYTRAIDPAQYGTISLLLSAAAGVAILLTLGLDLAIFRTYFELADRPRAQQQFIDSVWRFLMIFPSATAATCGGIAWIALGEHGRFSGPNVLLALMGAALGVGATTVPLSVLRAEQRLRAYLLLTGITTTAVTALTLVLVVVVHQGVRGWLIATATANALTLVAAAAIVPWHPRQPFDWQFVRRSIVLGVPLVPHFVSHWALQLADRSVLAGLVSAASLGVYSLAANLGLPVMILVQSLNLGFLPTYARAGTQSGERSRLPRVVVLQAGLVTAICVAGAVVAEPLVSIIAPRAYWAAGPLVGWIMLGYGFLGLYYIPMNGVSLGAGQTRFVWVATSVSALANIGLLFAFVPGSGIMAAAIASAAGYAVLLLAIFVYANRPDNPVEYQWRQLLAMFGFAAAIYAGAVATTPAHGPEALSLRVLWLAGGSLVYVAATLMLRRRVVERLIRS